MTAKVVVPDIEERIDGYGNDPQPPKVTSWASYHSRAS